MHKVTSLQPLDAESACRGETALKALRMSDDRYRRLFETSRDGVPLLKEGRVIL